MTPHDRYQRRMDLAGEIKQADDLVAECRRDVDAKLAALTLANTALEKQLLARAAKHDEARLLAKEASDDFLSLVPAQEEPIASVDDRPSERDADGGPYIADESGQGANIFASPFTFPPQANGAAD